MAYNPKHMGGFQVFIQALLNMNTIISLYNIPVHETYKLITDYSITHISGTPTFYRTLFSKEIQFNNVKRVTLGGELTDDFTIKLINFMFPNCKINNIYATTENGAILISDTNIFKLTDNIKISDNSTLLINNDGIWSDTGDIVETISYNRFKFIGRQSGFINVGGVNVNPYSIEETIRSIEGVIDVRVYAKSNSLTSNIICCDVAIQHNCDINEDNIKKYLLKNNKTKYEIPRIIKFVDTIEYTKNIKAKR